MPAGILKLREFRKALVKQTTDKGMARYRETTRDGAVPKASDGEGSDYLNPESSVEKAAGAPAGCSQPTGTWSQHSDVTPHPHSGKPNR